MPTVRMCLRAVIAICSVTLLPLTFTSALVHAYDTRAGRVTLTTPATFAVFAEALKQAIADHKMGLVCHANAQAGAASLGKHIPGNQVLMVYRPDFAVRMLEASVEAGFEAPIRLYIYENADGSAPLTDVRPSLVFKAYGNKALDRMAAEAVLLLVVTSTIAGPDNIVIPSSYKNHVRYTTVDRPDNKTVREIYITPESAKVVKPGEPLPHGTVITMEVYRARVDEKGEPVKDAEGRFIKGDLTGIFVMEKQAGWGADYTDDLRNGEWEYARFTPEGQRHPNADTTPCFQCHKPLSGQDFVFTQSQLLTSPK